MQAFWSLPMNDFFDGLSHRSRLVSLSMKIKIDTKHNAGFLIPLDEKWVWRNIPIKPFGVPPDEAWDWRYIQGQTFWSLSTKKEFDAISHSRCLMSLSMKLDIDDTGAGIRAIGCSFIIRATGEEAHHPRGFSSNSCIFQMTTVVRLLCEQPGRTNTIPGVSAWILVFFRMTGLFVHYASNRGEQTPSPGFQLNFLYFLTWQDPAATLRFVVYR